MSEPFIKIIDPNDWSSMQDQGISHFLPVLKTGHITELDRRLFHQKTAASEQFLHDLQDIKLASGDIPVHINAIGATEFYGNNRKGDSFSAQTCKDRHHTFVKKGRIYTHHRNKDPNNSFGKVAASCFNEPMGRIELMVIANGNKEASARNGGKVLPDEFLSKLEKTGEVPFSMGCSIKFDQCSLCSNKAKGRAQYCDENTCRDEKTGEFYPGCKNGLGSVLEDGRVQYVDNIEPTFFDASFVTLPAYQSGYGVRADYLQKQASYSIPQSTTIYRELPESDNDRQKQLMMRHTITKLADYQSQIGKSSDALLSYGLRIAQDDSKLGETLKKLPLQTKYAGLRLLAENGILLSPESYADAFYESKTAAAAIRENSETVWTQIIDSPNSGKVLQAFSRANPKTASAWFPVSHLGKYCLSEDEIRSKVSRGSLLAAFGQFKSASFIPQHEGRQMARDYAIYKAAALCFFPKEHLSNGFKIAVLQSLPDKKFCET